LILVSSPITLAIIKALIITSAGRTYAIPITSVQETIMVDRKDVLTVERKEVIQLRDATLPLLRLGRFFEISGASDTLDSYYVVVVGVAEKRLGIVVDDLIGQQDIVIKSIGETFKGFKGISGAADLGDPSQKGEFRVLAADDENPLWFSFREDAEPGFEREVLAGFARVQKLKLVLVPVVRWTMRSQTCPVNPRARLDRVDCRHLRQVAPDGEQGGRGRGRPPRRLQRASWWQNGGRSHHRLTRRSGSC
jgi:hypothetical protein